MASNQNAHFLKWVKINHERLPGRAAGGKQFDLFNGSVKMAFVLGAIGSEHYKYQARAWRTEHLRKQAIDEVTKMLQAFIPEGFEVEISECDSPVPGFPHAKPYKFRGMLHDPNPEGSDAHFFVEGYSREGVIAKLLAHIIEGANFFPLT